MPRWYITGPIDKANETELKAYQALQSLDDSWSVCWTYYYLSKNTAKEGDFLILGPDGRLLVLEVKKRSRIYTGTGRKDGVDGDQVDDAAQLQQQKDGVIKALQEKLKQDSDDREVPFIVPALFSGEGNRFVPPSAAYPIAEICGASQLRNLAAHWKSLFPEDRPAKNVDHVRNLFHDVYGNSSVDAEAKFLKSTDRLILDRLSADMSLLDSLAENQQILVRGGAGSGKTWLAERLAQRWAEDGKKVLFLCYNRALGADLTEDLAKTPKGRKATGSITVHTWESLAEKLAKSLTKEKRAQIPPLEKRDDAYYEKTLPTLMLDALTEGDFKEFDALVVDEAQDHNNDWWDCYYEILKEGKNAQMGIFYDPAQRPKFRNKTGCFELKTISAGLSQPAHFHLNTTRRYTRPMFDFLQSLASNETNSLIFGLYDDYSLLAGPEVIRISGMKSVDQAKNETGKILGKWLKDGLVDASDVLILTRHDPFAGEKRWFINGEAFSGKTITPAHEPGARARDKLRVTSFHKSKGLDAKAVVMLGTYAWNDLQWGDREGFWTAASRARQLLAIVEMEKPAKPATRLSGISFD